MSSDTNLANVLAAYNSGQAQREREAKLKAEERRRVRLAAAQAAAAAAAAEAAAGGGSSGSAPGAAGKSAAKQGAAGAKSKLKGAVGGLSVAPKAGGKPTAGTHGSLLAAHAAKASSPATAPLPKRVKDVLDALQARVGDTLTPSELQAATGLDVAADADLRGVLHKHARVQAGPGASEARAAQWYAYQPEVAGVHDRSSLANYVRDLRGRPALAAALRKAYGRAAEDLAALQEEGRLVIIGHQDPAKEVVFACDMMGMQSVSDDVRGLWFEVTMDVQSRVPVPGDVHELQAAVTRAGLRSALAHQPLKRFQPAAAGGRKGKARKPRQQRFNAEKATNAHMPHLFTSGPAPAHIDS